MHPSSSHPARRIAATLCALCAALLLAAPAHAAEPDLGEVVSRLPPSVDLVLAVDNGAHLRKQLGAMPLVLALASQPRPEAIVEAWSGLAQELGMTDAEAFDLLLGQRMIIAGAELQSGDPDEPRWALLSEIDPETERNLRAKLEAVPRHVVRGHVVSEFEHGSFLMATSSGRLRCNGDGAFQNTPAARLLLIAPASDRALFEQLLPLLKCSTPASSLSELPGGRAVAAMRARDAVFLYRIPEVETSPDRFVAANIGVENGEWKISMTLAPATGWAPDIATDAPERWSPRIVETLPANPALVMVGSRKAVREARLWAMPLIGLPLHDPESAGLDNLLGARAMFAVWLHDLDPAASQPEVLMASQTPNLDRLIEPADGYLRARTGTANTNARHTLAADYTGADPTAVRSMNLPAGSPQDSVLNWLYVPEETAARPGVPTARAARPGWWVLHYQPQHCDGAGGKPAGLFADLEPRRYLHLGAAEPRRWSRRAAALADQSDNAATNLFSSPFVLPQLWSLRWAAWYDDREPAIRADVAVRLAPPKPRSK